MKTETKGHEDYLYLSCLVGIVMKRIILLTVRVHHYSLSQHRTWSEALLQDFVVSCEL